MDDNLFRNLLAIPTPPSKWTFRYRGQIIDRSNKRIEVLRDRIDGVTKGRVMPDLEQVTIGGGRQFRLCVMFLDICNFSARPNWAAEDQKMVLAMMNIFMAEMLNIVRDFGGTYEKNTGDGLMAYFGDGETTDFARVKPAIEAAVVMHHVNDTLLTPWFKANNIEPVVFRVGLDLGPITIARVGLRGDESSTVAIGTPANIACKLMKLIPNGGICIGDDVNKNLPNYWMNSSSICTESTGFVYINNQAPYPAWTLNYRLPFPHN